MTFTTSATWQAINPVSRQAEGNSASTDAFIREIDRLRGAIFSLHDRNRAGIPAPDEKRQIDAAFDALEAHAQIYRAQRHGTSFGVDITPDKLARLENYAAAALQDAKDAISSMKPAPVSIPTSQVGNLLGDTDKERFWVNLKIIESLVIDKQGPIPESDIGILLNAASAVQQLNRQCKATLDLISRPGNQTDPALTRSLYERIGQFDRGIHLMLESALDRTSPARNLTAEPHAPANDTGQATGTIAQLDVMDSLGRIRAITDQADSEHRPLNDSELAEIQAHVANVTQRPPSDGQQFTNPDEMLASVLQEVHEHQATHIIESRLQLNTPAITPMATNRLFAKSMSAIESHLANAQRLNQPDGTGMTRIQLPVFAQEHPASPSRETSIPPFDPAALRTAIHPLPYPSEARSEKMLPPRITPSIAGTEDSNEIWATLPIPLATNRQVQLPYSSDMTQAQQQTSVPAVSFSNAKPEAESPASKTAKKTRNPLSGKFKNPAQLWNSVSSRLAGQKESSHSSKTRGKGLFGTSPSHSHLSTSASEENPGFAEKIKTPRKFRFSTGLLSRAGRAEKASAASLMVSESEAEWDLRLAHGSLFPDHAHAWDAAASGASLSASATDISAPVSLSGLEDDQTSTAMTDPSLFEEPVNPQTGKFKADGTAPISRRTYTPSELSEPVDSQGPNAF